MKEKSFNETSGSITLDTNQSGSYVCESDGYLYTSVSKGVIPANFIIYTPNGNVACSIWMAFNASYDQRNGLFVRKGMKITWNAMSTAYTFTAFTPLDL